MAYGICAHFSFRKLICNLYKELALSSFMSFEMPVNHLGISTIKNNSITSKKAGVTCSLVTGNHWSIFCPFWIYTLTCGPLLFYFWITFHCVNVPLFPLVKDILLVSSFWWLQIKPLNHFLTAFYVTMSFHFPWENTYKIPIVLCLTFCRRLQNGCTICVPTSNTWQLL